MINQVKSKAGKMLFGAAMALCSSSPAIAYEVDCAILLCLSGGWPASAECNHARAVFIQRITPWPVEPPLQIWRCPMGAIVKLAPEAAPLERLYRLASSQVLNHPGSALQDLREKQSVLIPAALGQTEAGRIIPAGVQRLVQQISNDTETADIDISGPEFDFVRSIKVWNVMYYSHAPRGKDDDCREQSKILLGTYGAQGDFGWRSSTPDAVPSWIIRSRACHRGSFTRAVGVEWTDSEGKHGYEVVPY